MAIWKFHHKGLEEMKPGTYAENGVLERRDLQLALKRSIDAVAPGCLVIAEEYSDWEDSLRRIDLLAIDCDANLVVIELKRTENGGHMELQALRYAAMISTMRFENAEEAYRKYLEKEGSDGDARQRLLEFLGWDEPNDDDFAQSVRIVLVSAGFSKELATTVLWLNDQSLDITCVRVAPHAHNGDLLVNLEQIIPLPVATDYQIALKRQQRGRREARQSTKDFTRYEFNERQYGKTDLPAALIRNWAEMVLPASTAEICATWGIPLSQCLLLQDAQMAAEKSGRLRYRTAANEVIPLRDGQVAAVYSGWTKDTVAPILERALELGLEVTVVGDGIGAKD